MTDVELRLRCKKCDSLKNLKISDVYETWGIDATCERCGGHAFSVWYENYATIRCQKPSE